MPHTTNTFSIVSPCLTEAVSPTSFELLARGTESAISVVSATATTALLRPAVLLNGASNAFTVGVPLVVSFASETLDTDNMWSSGAPTIVTVNTAGTYLITVINNANLQNNSSHKCELLVNGNAVCTVKSGPGIAGTAPPSALMLAAGLRLLVADQITVRTTITGVDNNSTFPTLGATLVSYGV